VAQVEESTLKANRALDEALAAIKASLRRIDARSAGRKVKDRNSEAMDAD
jgi:hypothetical protein